MKSTNKYLILGGLALAFLMLGGSSDKTVYTDKNGVRWEIWKSAEKFWSASTNGYGGKFSLVRGYVSKEQAIENIEGNAAVRDPETGAILPGVIK